MTAVDQKPTFMQTPLRSTPTVSRRPGSDAAWRLMDPADVRRR